MGDEYNAADDLSRSYGAAIAGIRERIDSFRREQIGDATLYLADCRDVLPERPDEICAILTDPPYSSGGFQETGKGGGSIGTRADDAIAFDNLSTRGYVKLIGTMTRRFRWCEECYVFTDWKMWTHTTDALEEGGYRIRNMLVWDKEQMGMGMPWRNQHELIAFGKRQNASLMTGKFGNVLKCGRTGNVNHPTEKPVGLIEALIENSQSTCFLDPFMGSGTTGVAAANLGRKFIGIEIDPKHFEVACRRIAEAYRSPRLIKSDLPKMKQEPLIVTVLALDVATTTGWAHGAAGEKPRFGSYTLSSTGDDLGRYAYNFVNWLTIRVRELKPREIVYEAPILPRQTTITTLRKLYSLATLVEMVALLEAVDCSEMTAGDWRKSFLGPQYPHKGDRDAFKAAAIKVARMHGWNPNNSDEADALGIWHVVTCDRNQAYSARHAVERMRATT